MDMSIIIPCHNLEYYITPLLVSLNLQTLWKYEVELFFVCDNCTDNTATVIKSFPWKGTYKKISLIECNVQSCGLARNEGMKKAQGTYIWFIDGDDWLLNETAILQIIERFKSTEANLLNFKFAAPKYFKWKNYFSMVWQYAFRKDFIEDILFTKEQPHEDVIFMKKVVEKLDNSKVPILDSVLYYYNYLRPNSNMYLHFKQQQKKEKESE